MEPIDVNSDSYREVTVLPFALCDTFQPKIVKKMMLVDKIREVKKRKLVETVELKDGSFLVTEESEKAQFVILKINSFGVLRGFFLFQ